ncbi:MAG: TonB-dependent receptor [Gemmatimonadaceae bacterium]|nr:TonB-dependent receptor [Gemmatimonadaceae bacterium]
MRRSLPRALVLALLVPAALAAQQATPTPDTTTRVTRLAPVGVTATRWETAVVRTAMPLLVVDSAVVRSELPNAVGDLFRNLPGVDVTGVGASQVRLMIRGQRGQRILLAEDGMRLNNARRQSDFGELSSLTDLNTLARVEVLRGPASVLYGTDAIGGVVNQLTLGVPALGRDGISGTSFYRRNAADSQDAAHLRVAGREGRFGFALSGTQREARNYEAPAGRFGALRLDAPATVRDAGVRDASYAAQFAVDVSARQRVALRLSRYAAADAGFGYVDARAWGDSSGTLVRLLYPDQTVDRATLSWTHTALGTPLADRLTLTASSSRNARTFRQAIDIPFTPTAGMTIRSENLTDIHGLGLRAEATKVLAAGHVITYGADWYRDRSLGSDSSETRMYGFGPPSTDISTTPNLPNATFATGGVFAQAQVTVTPRLELGAGVRGQLIGSRTQDTPGLPADRAGVTAFSRALVGQANAQYAVGGGWHLVAAVGRAFRAPNLIERYFEGATAEGNGYQVANADLAPETSLNVDVGVKVRRDRFYAEVTYFDNAIRDGIRIAPMDTTIGGFDAYRNENVDRLRDRGIEALGEVRLPAGFTALAYAATLRSRNARSNDPVGDSYGSKLGGELGWREARGRYGVRYEVRHQGERKDIQLAGSPVGDALPAFTVQAVRGEVVLPPLGAVRPTLTLAVTNLANVLYAESSNTSFFRPEPPRSVLAALRFDF